MDQRTVVINLSQDTTAVECRISDEATTRVRRTDAIVHERKSLVDDVYPTHRRGLGAPARGWYAQAAPQC